MPGSEHDHPSLWVRGAAPRTEPVTGLPTAPSTANVVVVGGGIAGVATTLGLARHGVEPVLLEADSIANRASGRNDGQMLLGLGEHYNRIVGQFGPDRARRLWAFIHTNNRRLKEEIDEHELPCDFRPGGGLRLAETEHEATELADAATLLTAEGIDHELLDAAAVAERVPASRGFHGALLLPGESCVQPVRLVRGLADVAQAGGATICEHHCVTKIERGQDGARVWFDGPAGSGHVDAAIVVHCTSALARDLDDTGFLAAQLFPFRGQIIATEPLPEATIATLGDGYAMSSNFCYEYFRTSSDRRFVLGGMRWSVRGEEQGILDDAGTNPEVTANLIDYVGRHFPSLASTPFPVEWTGIMAGTSDGLPLLGSLPGQPGVFALVGFNGYGLSFAFHAGIVLADQIVSGSSDDPATELFAPRRFR